MPLCKPSRQHGFDVCELCGHSTGCPFDTPKPPRVTVARVLLVLAVLVNLLFLSAIVLMGLGWL
jgi:hypothetical protein